MSERGLPNEVPVLHRLPDLEVGHRVRHYMSGWTGIVAAISDEDSPAGQGRLVTVNPVYAGGHTWKAITVTQAELEPEGLRSDG